MGESDVLLSMDDLLIEARQDLSLREFESAAFKLCEYLDRRFNGEVAPDGGDARLATMIITMGRDADRF